MENRIGEGNYKAICVRDGMGENNFCVCVCAHTHACVREREGVSVRG